MLPTARTLRRLDGGTTTLDKSATLDMGEKMEKRDMVMHQVDAETLAEISGAHDELVKCVDWFLGRNDLEAVERLMPIVETIGNRLTAIYEANYPEIGPCIEAINRFGDEIVQQIVRTRTVDERRLLSGYVTEAISKWKQDSKRLTDNFHALSDKKGFHA